MIKVNFNTYSNYITDSLYQWDVNRDLVITGLNLSVAPEIHFSNANTDRAIVRQSTLASGVVTVRIPNSFLQSALTIKAYVGIYEDDTFKVIETIEIPVIARTKSADYTIEDSDEEIYSFNKLENSIKNLTARVEANGGNYVLTDKDKIEIANIVLSLLPTYDDTVTEVLSAPTISLDGDNLTITATDEKTESLAVFVDGVEMATVQTLISFDLSTLNLSAGTHEITVKARVNGYEDSEPSNAVSYTVQGEEITFTIDGNSYKALSGMTWDEWIESAYNTGGYVKNDNGIICNADRTQSVYYGGGGLAMNHLTIMNGLSYLHGEYHAFPPGTN